MVSMILKLLAALFAVAVIAAGLSAGYQSYELSLADRERGKSEIIQLRRELESVREELARVPTSTPPTIIEKKIFISPAPQTTPKTTAANNPPLTNAQIIAKVKPSVVHIRVADGTGTGIVIDAAGFILTNAHVVEGMNSANITFSNGATFSAFVAGRDEKVDLALLKVGQNEKGLIAAALGDSDALGQGEDVFALGYPFGFAGEVSFKEGTLSRRVTYDGVPYLETSAEIHPGNSGGPLVNSRGEVIGINTALYGRSDLGGTIKLAIPVNAAKQLIPELKAGRVIVATSSVIVLPAPPLVPSPRYSQGEIEDYQKFAREYEKVSRDINAGINAYREARQFTIAGKYDPATRAIENARILFDSSYLNTLALRQYQDSRIPYTDLVKNLISMRVLLVVDLKDLAQTRTALINALIAGDYAAATRLVGDEQRMGASIISLLDDIDGREEEFAAKTREYFQRN